MRRGEDRNREVAKAAKLTEETGALFPGELAMMALMSMTRWTMKVKLSEIYEAGTIDRRSARAGE